MLTPEESRKIASQALSVEDIGRVTLVPHDEGSFTEAGKIYNWRSYHLPQAGLFIIVRRGYVDRKLQFLSVSDVISLTRIASTLHHDVEPSLDWKSVS